MNGRRIFNIIICLMLVISIAFTIAVSFILTVPGQRGTHFWISIGALILCEMLTAGYGIIFLHGAREPERPVPALTAIAGLLYVYDLVVIAEIILFWMVYRVTTEAYIVIHLATLFTLAVSGGLLIMFTVSVSNRSRQEAGNVYNMRKLGLAVEDMDYRLDSLNGKNEYTDVSKKLKKLVEAIRYSDPMTRPQLSELEGQIALAAEELKNKLDELIENETGKEVLNDMNFYIDGIINMVAKRNKMLTTLK